MSRTTPETRNWLGCAWPADFGDPAEERRALREGAGLLDLTSLRGVCVRGADAASFLQGLVSQDVVGLAAGSGGETWLLDNKGKILFHAFAVRLAGDEVHLFTAADATAALTAHLDRYLIMEDAALAPSQLGCLSIQGPRAEAVLAAVGERAGMHRVAHDRCGHGGWDVYATADLLAALKASLAEHTVAVGFDAFNDVRVAAGLALFGIDMETGENPLVYGQRNRIANRKGCFIGQETVAMTRDRGRPPRILVQLGGPDHADPAKGRLFKDDREIGMLTSVAHLPGEGRFALAIVKFGAVAVGDSLTASDGAAWTVRSVENVKA